MLFGETVAVYCEKYKNSVRTSKETHYVTTTKNNRLMLFRGNGRCFLWEPYGTHRYTVWVYKSSLYLRGNTLRIRYKAQPVNAVWGNIRCLLWEPYGTHRYTVWAECRVRTSQETHHVSTTEPNRLMLFIVRIIQNTHTLCGQNAEF
jgi:hypothetical protein